MTSAGEQEVRMRFVGWLQREPRGVYQLLKSVVAMVICIAVWLVPAGFVTMVALSALGIDITQDAEMHVWTDMEQVLRSHGVIPLLCLIALTVTIEELVFRGLPLFLVHRLSNKRLGIIIAVAVISSVIFGWAHGGLSHIAMQGGIGFGFSILYLKCGGLRGAFLKPLLVTSSTHFLWDVSLTSFAVYIS